MNKMKALGMFVFAGSASIGVMNTKLFDIEKVIEISDEMLNQNAKHFIHNYPEIPVIPPSIWENEEVEEGEYDLLYGNCPCSGLSSLTRTRSVDNKANIHFYRMFNEIQRRKPKTFIIENSNNLIKLGYPILKDMFNQLCEYYTFTIVKDQGGNHNVAMQRARTLIVGWRRDVFDNGVPLLKTGKQPRTNVRDTIAKYENCELGELLNHELVEDRHDINLERFFEDVPQRQSVRQHIVENWDKYENQLNEKEIKSFATLKHKYETGQNSWDKSPRRFHWEDRFPSMSSVANIIHPSKDRPLTIREYAAIMNYPDDFEFVKDAQVPVVQAISQGVPANFFEYIANEAGQALLGNRKIIKSEDILFIFQDNVKGLYKQYTLEDANSIKYLEIKNRKDGEEIK